jgi:N-acetylneuraminate synthase
MPSTLFIAEAGVNHDGSLETALELVDAAADAGADVVKFQTFDAQALVTDTAPQAAYQRERAAANSQLEMLQRLQLDREAHERLASRCAERGIEFLSTAFDEASLGWLREIGLRRIKVPSGELTNGPLLLAFARCGLPLIVSTGMATLAEVEAALGVISFGMTRDQGTPDGPGDLRDAYALALHERVLAERVCLLHCTSSYPAAPQDVNLAAMNTLAAAFGVPVGYSDHTLGIGVSIAAVARGATVIEKHMTLDRARPGPDHAASLEPAELAELVSSIRDVEVAIGSPVKLPTSAETDTAAVARRSLVAARPIARGEQFDEDNLTSRRPGTGRSPMDYWRLLGRPAGRDYREGELIEDGE